MTDLPQLRLELETLIEQAAGHRAADPMRERRATTEAVCRAATAVSQVMEELVFPALVRWVSETRSAEAEIEWDLIRVLVHELIQTDPVEVLHESFIAAIARHAAARRDAEHGVGGMFAEAAAAGLDIRRLDLAIGERLAELAAAPSWHPLQPAVLQSLRSSIPPGATPFEDL